MIISKERGMETLTIKDLRRFTYTVYLDLLKYLGERYEIIPCSEVTETEPPFVALRHDVDGSLESALEMAEIESKAGLTVTYFILLSHKLYNVFEEDSLRVLKEIVKLGHEIGLHYDPEAFGSCYTSPYILLDKQIEILSLVLGTQINVMGRHRNSLNEIEDPFLIAPHLNSGPSQLLNMGESQYFDLIVKDSCREWVDRFVNELFTFEYDRVQLVTHPFLWTKDQMSRRECLQKLFNRAKGNNKEYYDMWLRTWEELR